MNNALTSGKKSAMLGLAAISMLIGAAGVSALKINAANAQAATPAVSATTSQGTTTPSTGSSQSTAQSNENSAHEAQESAQWEAAENAGQKPWTNPSAYGGNPHTQSSGSTTQ